MKFINYGNHHIDKNDLYFIKKSLFSSKITQAIKKGLENIKEQ